MFKYKTYLASLLLVLTAWSGLGLSAQTVRDVEWGSTVDLKDTIFRRPDVRKEVLADPNKCAGLEGVYDFSPKAATPAPKGYEAVYIGHYGRHGSRFAYTAKGYTIIQEMLAEGHANGNLTPAGEDLYNKVEVFWKKVQYQVGDLTPLGWEQHRRIVKTMVESFPKAFGKGCSVDACSSAAQRSILSMTSACYALALYSPQTKVYAHQSALDIQACRPNQGGKNPFKYKGPESVFPYPESNEEFFYRHFPQYRTVLARFFKDPDAALAGRDAHNVFFHLYMFVGGQGNLPDDIRLDLSGFFTPEEYATMWEVDNYERLREYIKYRTSCCSVIDDIIVKADARLAAGSRGADMRFGHDHVLMALFMIMDLDGFGYFPEKADDLAMWFQSFRSPKAANIQFVFIRPKGGKAGDTLVKILLCGEEIRLGTLAPVSGPYYSWAAVKDWLLKRIGYFVTR